VESLLTACRDGERSACARATVCRLYSAAGENRLHSRFCVAAKGALSRSFLARCARAESAVQAILQLQRSRCLRSARSGGGTKRNRKKHTYQREANSRQRAETTTTIASLATHSISHAKKESDKRAHKTPRSEASNIEANNPNRCKIV
jgi:hypothetical protein